jgi:hypothetical protein
LCNSDAMWVNYAANRYTGSLLVQENRLDYASGGASLWANFED